MTAGQLVAVREQERGADRRPGEHRRRDPRDPVVLSRRAPPRSGGPSRRWRGRGRRPRRRRRPPRLPPPTRIVLRVALEGSRASPRLPRPPPARRAGAAVSPRRRASSRRAERPGQSAMARPDAAFRAQVSCVQSGKPSRTVRLTGQSTGRRAAHRGFQAQRRTARVPGALSPLRARGHPAGGRAARPRGERAVGGDQGRPRVGPPRARHDPPDGLRSGRACWLHLRRGAPLGLRRHRPGDLRAARWPRPASPARARPSRSAAGCPSASATATRSSSARTP